LQHVDDPTALPHYQSDHPESAAIERELQYCTANGISFRTLRDGEVVVLEDFVPTRAAHFW
jgi:dipeptidase E